MITGLSIPSKKRGAGFYGPLLSVPARAGLTVLTAALVLCAPVSAGAADTKPDAAQLIDRVINAHRAGHFQQASDAVDALIALRPARADYRLEKLRLTALTPGENKPGLSPQLEILCSSNDGRVCEQARFVAQLTNPVMPRGSSAFLRSKKTGNTPKLWLVTTRFSGAHRAKTA